MKHIYLQRCFGKFLSAGVHTLPLGETDVDVDIEHFSENANAITDFMVQRLERSEREKPIANSCWAKQTPGAFAMDSGEEDLKKSKFIKLVLL